MIYKSGNFSLNTETYGFECDGLEQAIEPQVFDLLVYLLQNRARVVTRNEMLDNLWGGRIVSESALNGRLKLVRKAVCDDGKQQRVIKTIHRRGYQFIAEVSETAPSESNNKKETFSFIENVPLSDKPSIAVLPFTNMSDDPEQEYFSDGITEDIITGLSKFRELFVIARGSSFALMGQSDIVTEAARKLGANYVLEGSVRRGGNRVRITAQLSDTITGNHFWAEKYDRVLDDVFMVQDDVTQKIISTLVGRLEDESREIAVRKSAANLSAYDYFLRGKHCWPDWRGSKENILEAREMFEKARKLDPDYASAYIGLTESFLSEFWSSWTKNRISAGEYTFEYASKAVELDNRDSHAHMLLGFAHYIVKRNFELAEMHTQKALDLNPNDYWNYCLKCELSMCNGNFTESMHWGNEAIRRNPFLPDNCLHVMGFSEYFARRYENSIKTFGKLTMPNVEVKGCIAACYAQLGMDDDANVAATEFRVQAETELTDHQNWDNDSWRDYWSNLFTFKDSAQLDHLFDGLHKASLLK